METWKECSSLIIAAHNNINSPEMHARTRDQFNFYDYKFLLLKRNQNSNILPGAYVFPGGSIELEDSSIKWYDLFHLFGINKENFKNLSLNEIDKPFIFQSKDGSLPREISLRISAIRETFEECGILICKKLFVPYSNFKWAEYYQLSQKELEFWQAKVHSNASEFFNMCMELHCYPNLWALSEWSNWLTPTTFPSVRRFNVIFFITLMPSIPFTKYEKIEMEDLIWTTPKILNSENFLPPPQQYEISRLEKFLNIKDLYNHLCRPNKSRILTKLPVIVELSDGIVQLLPGDIMYPKKIDLEKQQVINESSKSIEDFRNESNILNRIEWFNNDFTKISLKKSSDFESFNLKNKL